jgi:transposase
MGDVAIIGLDIAKSVFQAHGADTAGSVVFRKKLNRSRLLAFFVAQPRCVVAMEACAGAHHWGRELMKMGHQVRLIPPAYVKPFVKRQKNDMADAEAICEAAQRPTMRFVPVKDRDQQASSVVFRARDLLVRQRTQIINGLRSHLAEYGYVVPKGVCYVERLVAEIVDPASELPAAAIASLQVMARTLSGLNAEIAVLDREIARRAKEDPVARRLMTIPGIGPITAAAWLGLTPLQRSTGGKQKLGQITKMGERTLRRLLVIGASAVIKQALIKGAPQGSWLAQMLARKPRMLVAVALANKTGRIVWALLAKGGVYQAPAVAAA